MYSIRRSEVLSVDAQIKKGVLDACVLLSLIHI